MIFFAVFDEKQLLRPRMIPTFLRLGHPLDILIIALSDIKSTPFYLFVIFHDILTVFLCKIYKVFPFSFVYLTIG